MATAPSTVGKVWNKLLAGKPAVSASIFVELETQRLQAHQLQQDIQQLQRAQHDAEARSAALHVSHVLDGQDTTEEIRTVDAEIVSLTQQLTDKLGKAKHMPAILAELERRYTTSLRAENLAAREQLAKDTIALYAERDKRTIALADIQRAIEANQDEEDELRRAAVACRADGVAAPSLITTRDYAVPDVRYAADVIQGKNY